MCRRRPISLLREERTPRAVFESARRVLDCNADALTIALWERGLQLAIPRQLARPSRSFVISHRARRPRLCLAQQGQHTHLPEKGKEQKIVRFSTGPTAYLTRVRAESVCLPFLLRVMAAPCECGWHCRLTFVRPSTAAATVQRQPAARAAVGLRRGVKRWKRPRPVVQIAGDSHVCSEFRYTSDAAAAQHTNLERSPETGKKLHLSISDDL